MPYSGMTATIPLGQIGLLTDDAASSLPINSLAKANNIEFKAGRLAKIQGYTLYNSTALSGAVVGLFDYYPSPSTKRLIALTSDAKVWRDTGDGTFSTNTPIKTLTGSLTTDAHMLTIGAESSGRNKKLAIHNDANQVQIIDGDGSTTRDINFPSPDWQSGNYPTFGILYQNRYITMGSAANRHQVYCSTISDHENFVGTQFNTNRREIWQRLASGSNTDLTSAINAGTASNIFTTTNNDGYLVYGINKFNKVTITISQVATGSPVYAYAYWNGSAWTNLTLTTTPVYTALGSTSLEFSAPSDWVVGDGTESGGNNAYYAIRVLATTAGTAIVKATSVNVFNTNADVAPAIFPVFPGEGDGIKCAAVYRGLLFVFKAPQGVYVIDGRDPLTSNWQVSRYSDAFGVASPHATLQVLNDLIAANSIGSFTSLQASNAFGDFEAGDILANNKVEDYVRAQLNYAGLPYSQAIYYPEKKIAMWTGQSSSTPTRDRILCIDVAAPNPRISFRDSINPNCLTLRKDSEGILRPIFGTANGKVYLTDQNTYNNAGVPFLAEFQTNYTDLGQLDSQLAGKNKIFDFIDVTYVPTGNNNFFCDIYVDGQLKDTKTFTTYLGAELDAFVLDRDTLAGDVGARKNRLKLSSCTGNRISLRFYNNGNNESFIVERVILSFRLSGEQLYVSQIS